MEDLINTFEAGLSAVCSFAYRNSPELASVSGMFFYSFIVYFFLFGLRILRQEILYPQMEKNISDASNKKRAENRKRRSA
jgi:hypothetical protein